MRNQELEREITTLTSMADELIEYINRFVDELPDEEFEGNYRYILTELSNLAYDMENRREYIDGEIDIFKWNYEWNDD